jgi:L-ascorbate 6-phosphate lactonase
VGELVGAQRVVAALADQPLHLGALDLLPVPAKHEEFDQNAAGYPYLGYSLRLDGVTMHHTGDTIPYEGQVERVKAHDVDLLLAPINGRDFYRTRSGTIGNMDYREAGEFAVQTGARLIIPIHYGMFRGNTVPPDYLVNYLAEFHPEQAVHIMGRYGKLLYLRP